MDCSHTVPGPDSTAKWCVSPPKYRLKMPSTRTTWKVTDASNRPTCPGCTRSDWPVASSCLTASPASSTHARPPPRRWRTKPSPAKTPAEKDCWKPAVIWMPGTPARARQGRYRQVAGNMHVKEVRLDDIDDRLVICCNPGAAVRDAAIRDQLLTQLEQMIEGTDALSAGDRARLSGVISAKPGLNRFLKTTPGGLLRIDRARIKAEQRLAASSCCAAATRRSPQPTSRWAASSCWKSNAAGVT